VEPTRRFDLPVPGPYAFEASTFRFRLFGDDLASRWIAGGLHRVLRSGLPVRIDEAGVTAWGTPDPADVDEVAHLLGAHFDLVAFETAHPEIYARSPAFRPPLLADPFEMLVTSVTAQQISLLAAAVIRGGLVQRFGRRVQRGDAEWWAFPRQADVRGADLEGLKLSRAKSRTISGLADADLDGIHALSDEQVIERLTQLTGIGRWTAEWFLARCLGRPGAVAAGDLGVRKAVARYFSEDPIWPESQVRDALAPYAAFGNLTVHYLLSPVGG
jgi:DNA-3-methyladenine glycosylase II